VAQQEDDMKARTIEVPHTITLADGSELEVIVEFEVDGRDAPASWCRSIGTWDPPEYREVVCVGVRLDDATGTKRDDLIPLVENDRGLQDEALEQDCTDEAEARADAAERQADADREDRMLGQGRWER
jgi:hypothetical protein